MPKFTYTAASLAGKTVRGRQEAADAAALGAELKRAGLFLISASQDNQGAGSGKLGARELADFNRELGSMLSSGINLARAVSIMLHRDMPVRRRKVYNSLYQALIEGRSMSAAMASQGGAFPELLVNLYRAAEQNGSLARTANRMAIHYEKEYRLRAKIISAATYPIILLCLTALVVITIFTIVIPSLQGTYNMGELPGITRAVMAISAFFTRRYYVLIGIIMALAAAVIAVSRIREARLAADRLKLRLPVVGKLLKAIYTARFSRTLSSLYASGLPVVSALIASRGTVGNAYIESQFDELVHRVRSGSALSEALSRVNGFDRKLSATALIGEEAGSLEAMLLSVSDSFDYDAEQALTKLSAAMEPTMIIIMALIIGTVMVSVMLPIYNMYSNIQ